MTSIKRDLFSQNFEVRRLLFAKDDRTPSEARKQPIVELPKISAPTFHGDIHVHVLNLVAFREEIEVAINSNERRHGAQNFVYLPKGAKEGPAKQVIKLVLESPGQVIFTFKIYRETIAGYCVDEICNLRMAFWYMW